MLQIDQVCFLYIIHLNFIRRDTDYLNCKLVILIVLVFQRIEYISLKPVIPLTTPEINRRIIYLYLLSLILIIFITLKGHLKLIFTAISQPNIFKYR